MSTHYLVCDQCAELYNKPALEVTSGQLADAGGMITCPDCGWVCREREDGNCYPVWVNGQIDVYASEHDAMIYSVVGSPMLPVLIRRDVDGAWYMTADISEDRGIYTVLLQDVYDEEADSDTYPVYWSDTLSDCILNMWGWRHTMPLYGIKCAM